MSDRWNISIYLGDNKHTPVTDVFMRWEGDAPVLEGDVVAAEIIACALGELHHFAVEDKLGIPIIVLNYRPGQRLKFWWLFNEYGQSKGGAAKRIDWVAERPRVACMSCAEYTEKVMMDMLDDFLERNPEAKEWYYDEILEWTLETFGETAMFDTAVDTKHIPSDPETGEAESYRITFRDASVVLLNQKGWCAQSQHSTVVPILGVRKTGEKRSYRVVDVQSLPFSIWQGEH